IIEGAFVGHNSVAGFAFALLVIAACFTSFYSWRLIFMTFHGRPRATADVMHHVHESPPVMLVPLVILAIGALFAGVVPATNPRFATVIVINDPQGGKFYGGLVSAPVYHNVM
ncbi:penicillin-binding transpeptidase domain-containing protein, partial [Rhizobiaceae sp. 2RAB30]